MAVAEIIDTPQGTIWIFENGKTWVNTQIRTERKAENITQVITTKHEKFTLYRGGEIVREMGKFKENIPYHDAYPLPKYPRSAKESGYTQAGEDFLYELECRARGQLNEVEYQKQKEEFYEYVRLLRHKWNTQQRALRKANRKIPKFIKTVFASLSGKTKE